ASSPPRVLHSFPTRRSSDLRGPIYADVVFLAEGDASHLVSKEGYERCKGEPHFLQGIAEVIELAPDEIERHFNLPRGEGAAYERSEEHTSELQSRFDLVCRL